MNKVRKENIEGLQISLHKVGTYKMPSMHYHDAFEIYILENGDRSYLLEEGLIYLRPRDVLLIKRNQLHCTIGGTYVSSTLTFGQKYLFNFFTKKGIKEITKCFDKTIIRVRESEFDILISLLEKLKENKNDVLTFTRLLGILENNMSRKTFDLKSTSQLAAEIIDYVTENYKTIDNLATLAKYFHISIQHLCKMFKKHTNTTVIKYINILKINASCEYLSHKELTIAEVAKKSGFSNLQYFSNTFKSVTGVSPLNYRKNIISNEND